VNKNDEDIGAGDQGIMIGYATNESPERLPLTLVYATQLALRLQQARASKEIDWLRPDAKTQVTIKY
jgi:S-adenosylmethionine synthetase